MNPGMDPHYTRQELEDYFSDAMADAEIDEVQQHLRDCTRCFELANLVSEDLLRLEEDPASAHEAAYLRQRIADALEETRRSTAVGSAWGARLARWARSATHAGGAVRVVIRRLQDASRIVTSAVTGLPGPGAAPAFSLEGLWTRRRGAVRVLGESPVSRAEVGPGSPQMASGPEGDLVVRMGTLPAGREPLVLLVPLVEGVAPVLQQLRRHAGESEWSARFKDLPVGTYVVLFEPPEGTM